MRESGKVIKEDARKKNVTVEFERKSACEKCGMCMMSKSNMTVSLTLKNNMGAKIGDTVEVSMGDSFVLTSAAIVYIIPLILGGIGLLITRNMSDWFQLIGIGAGLVGGLIVAVISDRKLRNRKGFRPEIINILEKSKEEINNGKQ